MAENLMEPTDAPGGMSPDTVDRILKYLSGKMSGLIPETSEEVAARREEIGKGLGRAYDSVMNPVNAAGRLMRAPVAAGMRAVGIDAQSPYAPTAQAVQTNMNTPPVNPAGVQQSDVAMDAGVLPKPRPRVMPPQTPGRGALPTVPPVVPPQQPDEAMGSGGIYSGQSAVDAAMAGIQPPAAVPAAPAAPQKGLRDQFLERLAANKGEAKTGMTDEQKGRALVEAGLAIMAAASKPGSTALGAVGEGGQKGTAVAREMERINRERADKTRAEDRANLGTEFTLAGQDEDRAIRKEDKAETRRIREEDLKDRSEDRKATDTRENRRIDLLQQQIDAGKVQVVQNDSTGTFTILNTKTNEKRDTGIKFKRADDTPAEVKLLRALRDDPTLLETSKKLKTETFDVRDKGKMMQIWATGYARAAADPLSDAAAKYPTFDEFYRKANEGGGEIKRVTTQAEFDALPKGTEYVGPDGKRARK